ncbi:MAG: 30S ribosomal protein S3 [Parcubacteria group bacterium GW2011_GWF2_39_8b]|uniref:Small ribosomal subunit protein uS3 n=2 Tax=Candidatus Zambryskiibacteriota TaxID=1817925 RepID=A0A1G2T6A1_9BACT|nr:MAG: 30S ribosomal protein S3 [Parcubacteria group bacterium GW2011_GWF2_39_8b]KKR46200.1 MAG: 30S ribosomal protein S3 [Parcubacteria group bacterium GW2011_GWA2_40_14]OHA92807.1 MAG: 30S ribosomal protein S3 [Candidatus Zambryskibacteria bacterium RIFCSPHIGHO2_02_38_10.5]OHA97056.1 MAG: 30S ribosomal protein S3 [Candidatus Zambryskibacteria bacterium RIFCSPHIGHO2_02_FULL_39_82]OHA98619.1 MAG: 30S ribosomal protein S3 [Candidatus Zambryskibacteria bacterium RIFCSPHIGHO2_12_FULL_38_37]OHB09
MTHTVHPYSHRLGIIRDWKSRWFGVKNKYKEFLKSDVLLREYLEKKLRDNYVSNIEMERGEKVLRIIIETSRPGMIIGRSGDGAVKLKKDISAFLNKHKLSPLGEVKVDIKEIKSPESNATIVAQMVADGLEKRLPFRRVVKQMVEKVMANRDVLGVKIELSGRLGGASMARQEKIKKGRIPLQTFRADVDFCKYKTRVPYGGVGIKVWIYKGEVFAKK